MSRSTWQASEIERLVNIEEGLVDRRIFSDQELYELELERIFARSWNFMCHETQIPKPGDFFLNSIGEDRVIVTRDKEGGINVLLNTCRHRGNAVCRADGGNAASFMCTYHGWTYDLKGDLIGQPGSKELYGEDFKREEWGLITAAQVDSYKGFVFANLDPAAPALHEFLGEVGRVGLDFLAMRGNMAVVDGVQKFTIDCNWKLAMDNVVDFYHPPLTHKSAMMADSRPRPAGGAAATYYQTMVVMGEYGHVIGGPMTPWSNFGTSPIDDAWLERPETKEALGPAVLKSRGHPNVFPNIWVSTAGGIGQIDIRLPRGPNKTEFWKFTLLDQDLPEDAYKAQLFRAQHVHGPAGMFEQEDGENWDQSTRGTRGVVGRRYPLHYGMNVGRGEVINDDQGPARIETQINEHAQIWMYRAWAEWMAAGSWADLKENHSPAPSGLM